jgi:hypothetical protein
MVWICPSSSRCEIITHQQAQNLAYLSHTQAERGGFMQPRKVICVAIDQPLTTYNWFAGWPGGGGGKVVNNIHIAPAPAHAPAPAPHVVYLPHPGYPPPYPPQYPPQYLPPPPQGPPTYQYPPPPPQGPQTYQFPPPPQQEPPTFQYTPQIPEPPQQQQEQAAVPQPAKQGRFERFKAIYRRKPSPEQATPPGPLVIPVDITRPPPQVPGYDENQAQTMPAPPPNREWSPPPPPMPQTVPRPRRPTWTMPADLPPKHVPTVVPELPEWQPPPPTEPYPPELEEIERMKAEAEATGTRKELDEIKTTVDKIERNQELERIELESLIKHMEMSRTHTEPPATVYQTLQAWPPASLRSSSGTWHRCSGR